MSIYKPCDIRGNAATELTPALYEGWGRTLGGQLPAGTEFLGGGDVRGSTSPFLAALTEGLRRAGMNVVHLGLLPTPMVYFALRHRRAGGCAIVTASHNPATVNGLKWMLGDRPPTPADVQRLERDACGPASAGVRRAPGSVRSLDIAADYVAWLREAFEDSSAAGLHVVLDPMHGCWAGKARPYLEAVFPRCTFSALRDAADEQFGGCTPDSSRPEELRALCEEVVVRRADLGVAFDGDGDRVGFVDEEGVPLRAEEAVWVLLHSFGTQMHGAKCVYDLKFSDVVPATMRRLGAEPLVERSGHAFIRTQMAESNSLFGAEISGHYFYRSLNGGDDGLYTACRAIAHRAQAGRTISQLRRECPPFFVSPDYRVATPPDEQAGIIDRIRGAWSRYPQQTIDGVRIDLPEGWILVRPSVTESALTIRFEGRDRAALDALTARFCQTLPEFRNSLLAAKDDSVGRDYAANAPPHPRER